MALFGCGGGGGGGGGPTSEPDTFYVRASSGDDANDGTSAATAFRTIGAGLSRLSDGDTLIVGPGVYAETVVDPRGGVSGNPVILRADPTGTSTGDAPGLVLIDATSAAGATPAIRLSGVEFFELDGFAVTGGGTAGIQIRARETTGSRSVAIRNCQVFDNLDDTDGILVQDSSDVLLFNDAVYGNDRRGVAIVGSPRVSLVNLTVSDNGDRGVFVTDRSGVASSDAFLRNNIIQDNGPPNSDRTRTRNLQIDPGPPSSISGLDNERNLVFPIGYQPPDLPHPTDINEDALFVGPNAGNFRLAQPSGGQTETSPAIDAGVEESASGSPQVDFASLHTLSTSASGALDTGPIDLGYHALPEQLSAGGATWYVRISGSDTASGTSADAALRTIGEAASRAVPSDRIVVGPGTYVESIETVPSGEAGQRIVFFADVSGQLTGEAAGAVVVDARRNPASFRLSGVHFVTVDGFEVTGGSDAGIAVRSNSSDVTIRNCVAHDNAAGMMVQNSDDVLVFNNLVTSNSETGIEIGAGSGNVRVINNTVAGNGDRGIRVGTGTDASANAFVQNNITQDNTDNNLQANDPSADTISVSHNLVFPDSYAPSSLQQDTDVNADAQFAGGGDFHLNGTSPAVDAGDPATDPSLAAALAVRSATTDGAADSGRVDLGYHYLR